jgi:hypothetical protein
MAELNGGGSGRGLVDAVAGFMARTVSSQCNQRTARFLGENECGVAERSLRRHAPARV